MIELAAPAAPRKAALAFIFVTIVLDMLALGMVIPVLPLLVASFAGGAAAHGVAIYGLFGTAWAAMQFIFSPIMGALSDRFGRRPVVLLSNLGLGLDYILMALAPNLILLFVGRIISGIMSASISTGFAYVADVTPPEKRAGAFGMLGAAFGVGFVVGPAIGGVLGDYDPRLPFWVAAAFSLANALYGLFVLPESLPPERRTPFSLRSANPVGALKMLRAVPGLFGLTGMFFLYKLAHTSLPSVFVLYVAYRYGWGPHAMGLALAAVGALSMLVQGGLVRPFVKRFGERRAVIVGLFFGAAGFAVYGLAPTGTWALLAIPVMALWDLAGPATQGLMSRRVGPAEQGRLQGALSSVQGITGLIGPALFTLIFAAAIGPEQGWHLPGAPMFLAALLMAGAGAMAIRVAR